MKCLKCTDVPGQTEKDGKPVRKVTEALFILKFGGELTHAGCNQADAFGSVFREKMYVEDKIIILNLWDTAGQERFKSLIPSYIKDSAVAIVCYDVTSRESFTSVDKWIEDAKALRDDDVLLILAGNKSDLADRRQVSFEEGQEYA